MKLRHLLALLLLPFLYRSGAAPPPAAPPRFHDAEEGRATIRQILAQQPDANVKVYGLLHVRNGSGARSEVPVRYHVILRESGWQDLYDTPPSKSRPAERLLILHRPNQPNQYFFAREASPSSGLPEPKLLKPDELAAPFAGTDFSILDLGLEFFHWPEQILVDKEMRKGRSCRVISSRNPQPGSSPYAKVLSWIDFESGGLVRAEAYDSSNRLLKEFSVRSVKKIEDRWEVKELEIRNEPTDSRTRLEFNLETQSAP